MPTNESPLKKLLREKIREAYDLQLQAMKENIDALEVSKNYMQALQEIETLCNNRNRY